MSVLTDLIGTFEHTSRKLATRLRVAELVSAALSGAASLTADSITNTFGDSTVGSVFGEVTASDTTTTLHTVAMAEDEDVTIDVLWSTKVTGSSGKGASGKLFAKYTRAGSSGPVQSAGGDLKTVEATGSSLDAVATSVSSNSILVRLTTADSVKGNFELRIARRVVT